MTIVYILIGYSMVVTLTNHIQVDNVYKPMRVYLRGICLCILIKSCSYETKCYHITWWQREILRPIIRKMEIPCPEKFDFKAESWQSWKQHFMRFRDAADLSSKTEPRQVSTLLYCMGHRSEDIFKSFNLSDDDAKKFNTVIQQFDDFYIVKKNIVYERAQFNRRRQEPSETANEFITALFKLSETCEYGDLRNQLIRDRLVVGIANDKLSEKLQMDKDLTLEKAVNTIKQSEQVRGQQDALRGAESADVNVIRQYTRQSDSRQTKRNYRQPPSQQHQQQASKLNCRWCGSSSQHKRPDCPAHDVTCHKCDKEGHFARVCRSTNGPSAVHNIDCDASAESDVFCDAVEGTNSTAWYATITVDNSDITFKLDTGSDVTVLPISVYKQLASSRNLEQSDKRLCGANGNALAVRGKFTARLTWRLNVCTAEIYVADDVRVPLLGRDVIESLRLIHRVETISAIPDSIRVQYPTLFTGIGCMAEPYEIRIKPDATPHAIHSPRRIPLPLMPKVKAELEKMEKEGIIERVDKPTDWCAPMVVVPKRSGSLRLCVDLTSLNDAVLRERHMLPAVDQTLAMLSGATVFSKLDCNSSFFQIPLTPSCRHLTTFISPMGRFCFRRLPQGLSSASEVYQKRMSAILEGLEGVVCLIDDVLVFGKDKTEHDIRLHAVLQRLADANLTLNDKCLFEATELKFVGHIVSAAGIKPDPDKVSAIINMRAPANISELRSYLGLINQLSKFSASLAELSKPLRDLLKKDRTFIWTSSHDVAFANLKQSISTAPTLALYDPNKPTQLSADASSYGLGAQITQRQQDGAWRPVCFASRSLSDVETRYAQIEKEALSLTWACEHFSDYLIGLPTPFTLMTDHRPLVSLLSAIKNLDDLPPRIQRFRIRLMRFHYKIVFVPGCTMGAADALSRLPLPDKPSSTEAANIVEQHVDYVVTSMPLLDSAMYDIRAATAADNILNDVIAYCQSSWPETLPTDIQLRQYWHMRDNLTVANDIVMMDARAVIPTVLRPKMLAALHEGHQGIEKCRAKSRSSIWWPRLSADIEQYVTNCSTCAHWRQTPAEPLISSDLPAYPWQKVATDLFDLDGKHYLVVVDYYSRYIEVVQLPKQTSEAVIGAMKAIFGRQGIPVICRSDNGPCYASDQFKRFAAEYGFTHVTSSPRYAQSNGEAERAVRTVKDMLKKSTDLHLALLAYRSTPLRQGFSPAQLLMGRQLRSTVPIAEEQLLPRTVAFDVLQQRDAAIKCRQTLDYNKRHNARSHKPFACGQRVWIPDLSGEGTIISVLPYRAYSIKMANAVRNFT